jgi:transporter family protein
MNHIGWALTGMVGYSLTTLFVKLATRDGTLPGFRVLAIAVLIVCSSIWAATLLSGGAGSEAWRGLRGANLGWALATGVALAIAVFSLFRALALGPASVVVPIYGMFILGGAVLGIVVLGEALTFAKALGMVLAVAGVILIARA